MHQSSGGLLENVSIRKRSTHPPEPLDDDVVGVVVTLVIGVLLPVAYVNGTNATHEQLKFVLVKDLEHRQWDEVLEAAREGALLLSDPRTNPPLNNHTRSDTANVSIKKTLYHLELLLSVVKFVLVCDGRIGSVRLELALERLSEAFLVNGKS